MTDCLHDAGPVAFQHRKKASGACLHQASPAFRKRRSSRMGINLLIIRSRRWNGPLGLGSRAATWSCCPLSLKVSCVGACLATITAGLNTAARLGRPDIASNRRTLTRHVSPVLLCVGPSANYISGTLGASSLLRLHLGSAGREKSPPSARPALPRSCARGLARR